MQARLFSLSRQSQAALRKHLARGQPVSLRPAQELGRRALRLGLESLDLARIHEQANRTLVLPDRSPATREPMIRRAGAFFAESIVPVEQTHRTARESNDRLRRTNRTLRRRSADLAVSNRQLKQEIARRRAAEKSLRQSEQHYGQLLDQSRRMQEQLRLLSRQLLSAQEDERKKISRKLHDVIARTLTTINIRLSALKKAAALNTAGLERSIARTQALVERSVDAVHQFARELRPAVLDDLGLIPALHAFLKGFRSQTGLQVSLSAFEAVEQVNGEKRTVLFRVAQEAPTNIARHAQASQALVKLQKLDGAVSMTIKDDDAGFQPARALRARKGWRLGLVGMRERLEMVGGRFTVTSVAGMGTTVVAQVPLIDRLSGGRRSRTDSVR